MLGVLLHFFVCSLDRLSNHVPALKGYSINKLLAQVQLQNQLCPILSWLELL